MNDKRVDPAKIQYICYQCELAPAHAEPGSHCALRNIGAVTRHRDAHAAAGHLPPKIEKVK